MKNGKTRSARAKTVGASKDLLLMAISLLLICCSSFDIGRFNRERAEQANSFEEVSDRESPTPGGVSDLIIELSIKIPGNEPFPIKNRPIRSHLSVYPIVVNIDGQGREWPASCEVDEQNYYANGKRNPERGEGFKCVLARKVRLRPGAHVIYLASLEDRFEKETKIELIAGTSNRLVFEPIYWRDRLSGRIFVNGLSRFEAKLNGHELP